MRHNQRVGTAGAGPTLWSMPGGSVRLAVAAPVVRRADRNVGSVDRHVPIIERVFVDVDDLPVDLRHDGNVGTTGDGDGGEVRASGHLVVIGAENRGARCGVRPVLPAAPFPDQEVVGVGRPRPLINSPLVLGRSGDALVVGEIVTPAPTREADLSASDATRRPQGAELFWKISSSTRAAVLGS